MNISQFTLATLSTHPEYFDDVIRLIETEFHYNNHHFEIDFAPLVDPLNFENCFFYIDTKSNTVAAHLAVCPRYLVKGNIKLKIALIGGIATAKEFRGLHLFKNLMEHALLSFKDEVALFILWSDIENLYEKFSFFRTGGLIETGRRNFSINERPAGYSKTKFSELSENDFQTIVTLYHLFNETYFFTIIRNEKDWSIIRKMDSVDLYIKRDLTGKIIKYFCVNKGRDLTNIIHEISCSNLAEYQLLLKDLKEFKIWLPETEQDKILNAEIFYTAFIKTGNIDKLNEFLKSLTTNQLTIKALSCLEVEFLFNNKTYTTTNRDFLQYLFGPKALTEFAPLGLSLYIAGADSI